MKDKNLSRWEKAWAVIVSIISVVIGILPLVSFAVCVLIGIIRSL